jgi:spermidine/putrescine transport system ATP-binding protein
VFQSYALFPHLSVRENIGFGLRMQGADAATVRREVDAALDLVNLRGMGRRKPDELSGGQQQRVAIARALVNKPLVLLLDESLSALDRGLRKRMQAELKALQRRLGITFLFVTHDQEEAFAMSDKVVVMNEGRIEQIGTPREIYEEPANMFTARFVGEINVLEGTILEREGDAWLARVEGERLRLSAGRGFVPGERVDILLRPEDFQIVPMGHLDEDPETREKFEANGFFSGEVVGTLYKGATYDMTIRLGSGETVLATQFFDEDSEKVAYAAGDAVAVHWYPGWEVVFTHDGQ